MRNRLLFFHHAIRKLLAQKPEREEGSSKKDTESFAEAVSTQSLLKEIRDVLLTSNRAFVTVRKIEWRFVEGKTSSDATKWAFTAQLENTGVTPTKGLRYGVNFGIFCDPIDLGFEFPDGKNLEVIHASIGPNGILNTNQVEVLVDQLEKVKIGEAHAYIWGWVDYNDIFQGTNRHRSEFCCQVIVHGDLREKSCQFLLLKQAQHNGFDAECFHDPQPFSPRGYYKFLNSSDVEKVLVDGTLIISSFQYFRDLEEDRWGSIADPLEASSEMTVNGTFIIQENSLELEIANKANIGLGMFKEFANVSNGGIIDLSGARFVHTLPNWFIYSISVGELNALTTSMCVGGEKPYDACLKILNLGALRRRIFETGRIRDLNCNVSDLFEPGIIQGVEYEARSRDIREGAVIEPSPFKKDLKFGPQREVRFLFIPKEKAEIPKGRLTIEIPDVVSLYEEVFRKRC